MARTVPASDERPAGLEVRISPMRRRHVRAVTRIEHRVYRRPWSFSMFLGEISQRTSRVYLVARVGGRIVGYIGMLWAAEEAHVTTLVIDPQWRRRAIASRLLLVLNRAALDRGCRSLSLEVRVGNGAAQALYRRFGFVPAGVRKEYYPDNREDALVMWATDIDGPEHAQRLESIETSIEGTTVIDGRWA